MCIDIRSFTVYRGIDRSRYREKYFSLNIHLEWPTSTLLHLQHTAVQSSLSHTLAIELAMKYRGVVYDVGLKFQEQGFSV